MERPLLVLPASAERDTRERLTVPAWEIGLCVCTTDLVVERRTGSGSGTMAKERMSRKESEREEEGEEVEELMRENGKSPKCMDMRDI